MLPPTVAPQGSDQRDGSEQRKNLGKGQAEVLALRPGPAMPRFELDNCWAFAFFLSSWALDCSLVLVRKCRGFVGSTGR